MKKDSIKVYIYTIILFILTFFNLFVSNTFMQNIILLTFLVLYTVLSKCFISEKKINNIYKHQITLLVTVFSIVYVIFLYLLGFYSSFYKNSINFGITSFVTRILPYLIIVICSEIIRKIFITKENQKITVLTTLSLIFIEIITYLGLYSLWNLQEILMLIGYVIFSAISTNLLMNYIAKRYGILPGIIYRIITTVYIYIFPILPNVYLFFQSVYRIFYPYLIYLVIDGAFEINNFKKAKEKQKTNIILFIIGTAIIVFWVMLISCEFKYGLIAVGSSSMSESINKGDVIIYEEYKTQNLQEKDVIVFYKNNVKIVHRIVDIQKKNNELIYYTRGDNNQIIDTGFITEKDIIGVVKFRILYMGWPTVWLSEMITK